MENKIVKNIIQISAPIEKVWAVLTESAYTKIYMFGCEVISIWKVGSPLLWKMKHVGQDFIPVKGEILAMDYPKLLKYSVIDPHASYPDIPANYLNVTYSLSDNKEETTLTITQDGFEGVAEEEKRYKDIYNNGEGWMPILVQIKDLAEKELD